MAVELQLAHGVPTQARTDLGGLAERAVCSSGTTAVSSWGQLFRAASLTFQGVLEAGWGLVSLEETSSVAETSGRRRIYRFEEGKGRRERQAAPGSWCHLTPTPPRPPRTLEVSTRCPPEIPRTEFCLPLSFLGPPTAPTCLSWAL